MYIFSTLFPVLYGLVLFSSSPGFPLNLRPSFVSYSVEHAQHTFLGSLLNVSPTLSFYHSLPSTTLFYPACSCVLLAPRTLSSFIVAFNTLQTPVACACTLFPLFNIIKFPNPLIISCVRNGQCRLHLEARGCCSLSV